MLQVEHAQAATKNATEKKNEQIGTAKRENQ